MPTPPKTSARHLDEAVPPSFAEEALRLIRMDPRCVHRVRQPVVRSATPDGTARFLFGQGFEDFEVEVHVPVALPAPPRGLAKLVTGRAHARACAEIESRAREDAIVEIVDTLDRRLSDAAKQRLLALLETVQAPG